MDDNASKRPRVSQEGILFCIENPLLDISADVDKEYLDKYGLAADSAILAEEKHLSIYKEIVEKYKVKYIAGGATQNSARVAQWMLPEPRSVTFVGCVGNDDNGRILREKATEDGVRPEYLVDAKVPTGLCAVLITGKHRSMVTHLQAANEYKLAHLEQPEIWALVEQASAYYIGGFFLTVSPPSIMRVAHHAAEADKLFCMNLSAPFIPQFFKEPLTATIPYWDVIFGNESEALVFAREQGLGTEDIKEIALKMAALPKKNTKRSRVVVITQGADPTVVAVDGVITEYPVIRIDSKLIVDTNGAGDAFVGGFLSQLVQGKGVEECIKAGQYTACVVIQHPGCTFPKEKPKYP